MRLKNLFMVTLLGLAAVSCGNSTNTKKSEKQTAETATVMDIDALLAKADSLANQVVEIEGICTHTCKHGATKIFLMGSDDTKSIRVEAASLGSFDQKCVNSIVKVKGTLCEQRIDEAYLQQWEQLSKENAQNQHGETEAGCDSEKKARGETGNTVAERIAYFRAKIAARKEAENKEYLSFYFVEAQAYEIVE